MHKTITLKEYEMHYMLDAEHRVVPLGWSKKFRDFGESDGDYIRPPIRSTISGHGKYHEWDQIIYLLKSLNQF